MSKIRIIADVLREGGVAAYPTDTFYGLGAACSSEKAVKKIYLLKRRKPSKPLSVLVSDLDMVSKVAVDIPPLFWKLAEEFWPGPLTVILKASSRMPKQLLGPQNSIGIRQPKLLWLRELVKEVSFPITATSANISGQKEVSDPKKAVEIFYGKVDLIADGGETKGIIPSTVVDLTSPEAEILREGAVPRSLLEKYLKK